MILSSFIENSKLISSIERVLEAIQVSSLLQYSHDFWIIRCLLQHLSVREKKKTWVY